MEEVFRNAAGCLLALLGFAACAVVTGAALGVVWAVACGVCAALRGLWGW